MQFTLIILSEILKNVPKSSQFTPLYGRNLFYFDVYYFFVYYEMCLHILTPFTCVCHNIQVLPTVSNSILSEIIKKSAFWFWITSFLQSVSYFIPVKCWVCANSSCVTRIMVHHVAIYNENPFQWMVARKTPLNGWPFSTDPVFLTANSLWNF